MTSPHHGRDGIGSPVGSFSSSTPSLNTEYPFPRLDALRRPGSGSRPDYRRPSTAGSVSSVGGALDTSSRNWSESTRESGQNAVSTLLQPPIVRTGLLPHTSAPASGLRQPTARDIPPVALTNIPHVDPNEFKPYLAQVGALYNAIQWAKENEEEGTNRILRKNSQADAFEGLLEKSTRQSGISPGASRKGSVASLLSPTEPGPQLRRRSSAGTARRAAHAPTPLSTIPAVYFEDDFHLENPRTFDVVSERSEVVRPVPGTPDKNVNGAPAPPRKALATNAILQEKLSWYMDTIEVHLINSISTASSSFFTALGSLRELYSEAAESVERIKALRAELEALDKKVAVAGLEIVTERRRRENLKQLADATRQLKCVVDSFRLCESLVDDGNLDTSLDAVDALEHLIMGELSQNESQILRTERQPRLRDLRGMTALQSVNSDLETLRSRVGKALEGKILNALLGDLRHHITTVPASDTLKRWSIASQRSRGHNREPSALPRYMALEQTFRLELLTAIKGLHRARYTSTSAAAYKDAFFREMKKIVKRPLPSSDDDDTESIVSTSTMGTRQRSQQERSATLARNLRSLEPGVAEETLVTMYVGVGEALRRLGTQVKVLLDVASTIDDPTAGLGPRSPPHSPNPRPTQAIIDARMSGADTASTTRQLQEEIHQALDMSNLLGQAVDIAQTQVVKILRVRNEQSIQQTPTRFLRYFTINLLFANECEAVSGRSGTSLKNLVNEQIRTYLKQMNDQEQQKLAQGMDSDPWNPKDFSEKDSVLLARVLEASDHDPEAWTIGSKVWQPYDEHADATTNGATSLTNGTTTTTKVRPTAIESESFILPTSATLCLQGLSPYLELITGIPSLTNDIASSLISYLQLFNSRCTQLILGAGATRSVGLKNITTKHLALASQALSFIATLIPHIREFVRRHAGTGASVTALMGEFDRVRRLFLDHVQAISDKLVDIMASRCAVHVKAFRIIDWDRPSLLEEQGERGEVNAYMETLCKETVTLNKVLGKFLPVKKVRVVMEPVFGAYRELLGGAVEGARVVTEEGRERLLTDMNALKTRIGDIAGAGDIGDYLVSLVKNKVIKPPPETPAPPPLPAKEEGGKVAEVAEVSAPAPVKASSREETPDAHPGGNEAGAEAKEEAVPPPGGVQSV